jgi:hypothetical protein
VVLVRGRLLGRARTKTETAPRRGALSKARRAPRGAPGVRTFVLRAANAACGSRRTGAPMMNSALRLELLAFVLLAAAACQSASELRGAGNRASRP